jgi:hypothetical protein
MTRTHEGYLSDGRFSKRLFHLIALTAALFSCGLVTAPAIAATATATTTTLAVTPSNSIAARQIATFTASVVAGGVPVTVGTVVFYDGKLYLGSAQVVRDGSHGYAVGTATLKMALSVGTHNIVATFLPTATLSSSSSAAVAVTLSGAGIASLTLGNTSGSTPASFIATLSSSGTIKPTGSIVITDKTINNVVGRAPVDPAGFTTGYTPSIIFSSNLPTGIVPLDMNGDGLPDMLLEEDPDYRGARLSSAINGGDGTFKYLGNIIYNIEGGFSSFAVADYNGDGVPDFAAVGQPYIFSGNTTFLAYLGAGDGTFPTSKTLIPPASTGTTILKYAVVGDFDGDGIPDLSVLDATTATAPVLNIFPGKGDGTFGTPITNPAMTGITSLVADDFNHDGFADLAITVSKQNAVLILLGKGDGTFLAPVSYAVGGNPFIETTLQSRGNGNNDLAIWNQTDNTLGVLLGKGDGTFLPQVTYPLSQAPIQFVAADVTGDGLQDIVIVNNPTPGAPDPNQLTFSFSVVPGNGDGTYQPPVQTTFSNLPIYSAAIADFNRDGVQDIAVPNSGGYTVEVLTNGLHESIPLTGTVYGSGYQTIVATYSGDSNYSSSTSNAIQVNGSGINPPTPTFTVAANPSSLTIVHGHTGTATITVTPQNGFGDAVNFLCAGLPANSACVFSPSTVSPNGGAVTTTLTLATDITTAANQIPSIGRRGTGTSLAFLLGLSSFAGIRLWSRGPKLCSERRRSWAWVFCAVALSLVTSLAIGCSGSSSSPAARTPVGTSTVTVTAVSAGSPAIVMSSTLTVTVTN